MYKYYKFDRGELYIGNIKATDIVDKYGTPIYVYDNCIIQKKINQLRKYLPHKIHIYYSIKANPNINIIKILNSQCDGCEVASVNEMRQALKAGALPENIIFAGPGKDKAELIEAVRLGISSINIESLEELLMVERIAIDLNKIAKVGVRITSPSKRFGPKIKMGGVDSKFGIQIEDLGVFFNMLQKMKNIHFVGIHLYAGTQNLNLESFLSNISSISQIAKDIQNNFSVNIKTINFGGGIGVPYYEGETEFDIKSMGNRVSKILQDLFENGPFNTTKFIMELGRYLVAESGVYLTRVLYIKELKNQLVAIVDGGINHFLQMGSIIKRNYPINIIHKVDKPVFAEYTIAGRLCTTVDVIGSDVKLPLIESGDVIGVYKTGAYGFTAAPLLFLSHPSPQEILVKENKALKIRNSIDFFELA